jgi:hypothetical protein
VANQQWQIEGTSRNKRTGLRNVYTVTRYESGRWACSCPAHKYQPAPREDCQHILKVRLFVGETAGAALLSSKKIFDPSDGHRVFKEIA